MAYRKESNGKLLGILPTFASCEKINLKIESKASMYLLAPAIGFFGTNLYDFLLRVVGSEILRTVASFIIRSALTRIGL